MFALGASILGMVLGVGILGSEDTGLMPLFLAVGYGAIILTVYRTVRRSGDLLNPLLLILALAFVRFVIPVLVVDFGEARIQLFRYMGLTSLDWELGHVLAVAGMLGLCIGWLILPAPLGRTDPIRRRLSPGVGFTSVAGMVLGLVCLLLFVRTNVTSVSSTVVEGSFRSTEVQEGTGPFFYLSLMLISSSVLLSAFMLSREKAWAWLAFLPVGVAAVAFIVLGGRVRAVVPVAAVALLVWYRKRGPGAWGKSVVRPAVKWLLIGVPLALIVGYVGDVYRNAGLAAVNDALTLARIERYTESSFLLDFGHLHALAGAVHVGPGVLEGQSFWALLWPLNEVLGVAARSAGLYIAAETIGFFSQPWAFHSTLLGDAYLNFGAIGTALVTIPFGFLVRVVYDRFRAGRLHVVLYALAVTYGLRLFLESIEKWGEMLVVLAGAGVVILTGRLVSAGRPPGAGRAERAERPEVAIGA